MFEIKVTIEAPELAGAMIRLADAISAAPAAPSPVAPVQAPEKAEAPAEKPAPAKEPVKAEKPAKAPAPAKTEKPAAAPAPAPEPAPAAPVPAPVQANATQPEKEVDLATIARAGAGLVDQGKMPQIMELLKGYNVRAITELKQEQYKDFAKDLRALGADI